MSLTNPNRLVTEQRLNEYHNAILPYLGGMPDVLANKFNKSDLYSTDEKLIGRWIDGKPIYQRVFTGLNFGTEINDWKDTGVTIDDIDSLVNAYTIRESLNSVLNIVSFQYSSGLKYYVTKGFAGCSIIVAQYTKTTDSTVEIGSDTDYSTDEKIVGTWVDGKPIYQKTIQIPVSVFSSTPDTGSGYYSVGVRHNISNLGVTVDLRGQAYGNVVRPVPFAYGANSPDFKYFASLGITESATGSVFIECGSEFRQSVITKNTYGAYVTVQYTKTSD